MTPTENETGVSGKCGRLANMLPMTTDTWMKPHTFTAPYKIILIRTTAETVTSVKPKEVCDYTVVYTTACTGNHELI